MDIPRHLLAVLQQRATRYPVVTVTGPRQSGKTTLARAAFPAHAYVNLEDPEQRSYARTDPREFLSRFTRRVIIDEAQRVPDLFSYVQVMVDADDEPGRFILTGSHNFLLMRSIKQSLAGRAAVLHLLPLARRELAGLPPLSLDALADGRLEPGAGLPPDQDLLDALLTGGYPRIHARDLDPRVWLADYFRTYVDRDVLEVLDVRDQEAFGRFVRLCAGRSGQILNLSALAADAGITHPTARSWLSVLEASFLIMLLLPHHRNFNKRLVKSPKLYFTDTGLLCYLLRIRSAAELATHGARGAVFESYVVAEFAKNFRNRGVDPDMWFWRDSRGREVDLIVEAEASTVPVEIKSGRTVAGDFFASLHYWRQLAGEDARPGVLIYGGDDMRVQQGHVVVPWWAI